MSISPLVQQAWWPSPVAREAAADPTPCGLGDVPRPMRLPAAPRRLKILFVYGRSPLPMRRGDELTVAHLLEFLAARGHVVDFVSLLPPGSELSTEHARWLASRCRRSILIPHGRLSVLSGMVRGLMRGWPAQIGYFASARQAATIRRLAATEEYDIVYAYYIRSAEAIRPVARAAKLSVLALQLSQTLNTRRLAQTAPNPLARLFYAFESRRMAAYEASVWQSFDRVVLIGEKDVDAIRAACRAHGQPTIDNVLFGPHGVDVERFRPRRPDLVEPATVVLSGVMCYPPNVEAVLWFTREVWPRIRAVMPDAKLILVGRDPTAAVRALHGTSGVTVTGTVQEPAEWMARATVCVAPIRAAAGLQNKLLEYLAMGRPVVATTIANEGIGATDRRELLLADTPDTFAHAVLELFADADLRTRLGIAARRFVEERWTWEKPFLELERAWLEALAGRERAPAV
ncbi:MAG: glycosyltransferase family 4 protein [Geminicoccaceae bacterium]|nr:glycosyltransferase family 4 protein [Geminicoccaceae bacterium]